MELEAILKEIFTHSFDNISSRVFTREQHTVWNKLETTNKPEEEPNERLILRDLPPHISTRRRQTTFWIPKTTNTQSNYEDSRTFHPLDFTTDFTNHDALNICAWQVEQHVGTQQSIQEKLLSIRQGCLRESITGLQYFHTGNESYVAPNMCSWSNIQLKLEALSIYVNELPSTQSRMSQDDQDAYWRGPPRGDPDDPDDFGPPGRGLPRGLPGGGHWIGSLDIQEDCLAWGHQVDYHPETLETMGIKMVDSDLTWKWSPMMCPLRKATVIWFLNGLTESIILPIGTHEFSIN